MKKVERKPGLWVKMILFQVQSPSKLVFLGKITSSKLGVIFTFENNRGKPKQGKPIIVTWQTSQSDQRLVDTILPYFLGLKILFSTATLSLTAIMSSIDTNCMTLTRFVLSEQKKHPLASGDLTLLLQSLLTAVKAVQTAVRRAGISNL